MGQGSSKPSSEQDAETKGGDQIANGAGHNDTQEISQRKRAAPGARSRNSPSKRISFYETVDASEVLPYLIIGNLASSKNQEFLSRKNVKYILNLTSDADPEEGEGRETLHIPMEDDDDQDLLSHLTPAFEFINKAVKCGLTSSSSHKAESERATVLVHSYFGMSRSSAVIIAYLMKEKMWSLSEAYHYLKDKHSSVNPNDNFAVQLIRYEQELFDGKMSMTVKHFH